MTGSAERMTTVGAAGHRAREVVLHATCVAVEGRGVVLIGESGAGKSSLGLQLIDQGALLIADDVTAIYRDGPRLIARAPVRGAGLIEARGNGLLRLPYSDQAPVALFVAIGPVGPDRLPEPAYHTELEVAVPLILADSNDPAATPLIRLAVTHGPPHIPDTL